MLGINENRVVPISEDLTAYDGRLRVLRGLENMFRVDKELASGTVLTMGEWGVLNTDGKVERPTTTPVAQTYLCFAGTDRFDSKATGQVTLIMNSNVVIETTLFDPGQNYNIGDYLTVKSLGSGEAFLTIAGANDPKLAKVQLVNTDSLVCDVFPALLK